MRSKSVTALVLVAAALSSRGDTTGDRGLSGAAIGTGVGLVGAAVLGAPLAPGMLVGGAAGTVTGRATTPNQVDLGKPIWEH
jgi:hypothetical protein